MLSGTGDVGVSDAVNFSRQLAMARRQRDGSHQELAPVRSELHQVRNKNDELESALALLHAPFRESRSSLLALVSLLDAITSQFFLPTICMTVRSNFPASFRRRSRFLGSSLLQLLVVLRFEIKLYLCRSSVLSYCCGHSRLTHLSAFDVSHFAICQ